MPSFSPFPECQLYRTWIEGLHSKSSMTYWTMGFWSKCLEEGVKQHIWMNGLNWPLMSMRLIWKKHCSSCKTPFPTILGLFFLHNVFHHNLAILWLNPWLMCNTKQFSLRSLISLRLVSVPCRRASRERDNEAKRSHRRESSLRAPDSWRMMRVSHMFTLSFKTTRQNG